MYCGNCGKEIKDGAMFCRFCGAKTSSNNSVLQEKKGENTISSDNGFNNKKNSERKLQIGLAIGIGCVLIIAIVVVIFILVNSNSNNSSSKNSSYSNMTSGNYSNPTNATKSNSNSSTSVNTSTNSTYSNDSSQYILPDSDKRLITREELMKLTKEQVRLACNELYARHGRKFQDATIQAYFNSKSWYRGTIEPSAFDEDVFNDYEKKNKDIIVMYEKEMHYNE